MDVNKKMADKLARAQARREKRFANDRVVYAYRERSTGFITDNLILLSKSEEYAHAKFIEHEIFGLFQTGYKADGIVGYDVVKIGDFNKADLSFKKSPLKIVVDISRLYDAFLKYGETMKDSKNDK